MLYSESDEEEFVRLDKHEAQKLINGPDYTTGKDLESFDENQTTNTLVEKLKNFDGQDTEDYADEKNSFDRKPMF